MNCSTLDFPVLHYLLEFAQTHVHWVGDVIQPSHPLSSPFPPAFSLSQHQGLFQRVGFPHQVAKVLELQVKHQPFQWIFRDDFLADWLLWSPCSPILSSTSLEVSVIQCSVFLMVQLSHPYMTTGKTIILTSTVLWHQSDFSAFQHAV